MIRRIARWLSRPVVWLLKPVKVFAFQTRLGLVKRVLLELTSIVDWMLVFANVQNPTMLIHKQVYRGNFIFGKSVMVVDHEVAERDIASATLRGNRFMGVDIVTNDPGAFVTNAGPITMGQPARRLARGYIDEFVMTERVRAHDVSSLAVECSAILDEWKAAPDMACMLSIRGAVTRLMLRILASKTLPKRETDDITFQYLRRFTEFSLLGRYAPFLLGIVGTREGVRRDAFIPLRRHGVDNMVIDMTLFAAMFSLGTIVIRCVEFTREHGIDYAALTPDARKQFVIEAQRLAPTVTTVHRIVEEPEMVDVCGRSLTLQAGDEVAYPFACINRDPRRFSEPERFRLDRPREEVERVLSWSTGPHVCPAKELSILVTVLMLDTLATRFDLRRLDIFNPEF